MTTEAQRKAIEKYHASPRGIAALKRAQNRYNQSRKGKAARTRYARSCKGKEAAHAYQHRRQVLN